MLDISTGKLVRVIFLAREYGPESHQLHDYISGLNEDEQISLVACMWIGRESFGADEFAEAVATAREEATTPTADYLLGVPLLSDYLESGLEPEDHLQVALHLALLPLAVITLIASASVVWLRRGQLPHIQVHSPGKMKWSLLHSGAVGYCVSTASKRCSTWLKYWPNNRCRPAPT